MPTTKRSRIEPNRAEVQSNEVEMSLGTRFTYEFNGVTVVFRPIAYVFVVQWDGAVSMYA